MKDCYFLSPFEGGGPDNGVGTPLSSDQMKLQASLAGWDFWGAAAGGMDETWFMPANAYPALAWQTEISGLRAIPALTGLSFADARAALLTTGFVVGNVSHDFDRAIPAGCVLRTIPSGFVLAGTTIDLVLSSEGTYDWAGNPGNGTAANPYQIRTAGQLESLSDHPELWDKCFLLMADVDITGRTYPKALIAPDINDTMNGGFQGTPFTGTFDGQDHAIRHLTIGSLTMHDYVGLFGLIAEQGRVQNLHLADADIKGGSGSSSHAGVLAGHNAGTVTNCSATGIIAGGKGEGLLGSNSGNLIDCLADITRIQGLAVSST